MLFLLQQRLFGVPLRGGAAAHHKALAFMVTGRASAETLSLVELSNCSRQWLGLFATRLRHLAGPLLPGRLLIYILVCWQKTETSEWRRDVIPHAPLRGAECVQAL